MQTKRAHRTTTIVITAAIFLAITVSVKARLIFPPYKAWREWFRETAGFDPALYDAHAVYLLAAIFLAWLGSRRGHAADRNTGVIARTADELGLRTRLMPALIFACIAVLPMFAVGMIAGGRPVLMQSLFVAAILAPLAEELLYRGWAFGRLVRRGGMGFWSAAFFTGVVFGMMHIPLANYLKLSFTTNDLFTLLITGAGGVFFAWLFKRWNWNLWVPILLHAGMNMVWDIFRTSGVGGWEANLGRGLTIAAAVVLTLNRDRFIFFRDRSEITSKL